MQVVSLKDITDQNESIVYFNPDSGLLISTNVDHYFAYFKIQDTDEYEFVSPFLTSEFLEDEVKNKDLNIIQLLILGAKNLATSINENKVTI